MRKVRLGRTELDVTKVAFGALPVQRRSMEEGTKILRAAFEQGINFFDTARAYTDSEEKIGNALADVRQEIIIATKSGETDKKAMMENLDTSLELMKTDYIDIYQLHNPSKLPDPKDPDSLYGGLLEAKRQGKIRFIGITNHSLSLATEAVRSGDYDTVQFPCSHISSKEEIDLVRLAEEYDVGFIAMKALSGGLITNAKAAFGFFEHEVPSAVPIWGIQTMEELMEFIALDKDPVALEDVQEWIVQDRAALQGNFCRGCGYCLPCTVKIPIPFAARMSLLLSRAPYQQFLEADWHAKMQLIETCTECGLCKSRCPYKLDVPNLLRENLRDYRAFYEEQKG